MGKINNHLQKTPVAIIGMAAIFAEAKNLEEYWKNIVVGKDCITDVPPSRWKIDDYYDPDPMAADKTLCKRGGIIPEGDLTVEYTFGITTLGDWDNPIKPFQDVLQKKYGFDDRRIMTAIVKKKVVKKGDEFIYFTIDKHLKEIHHDY